MATEQFLQNKAKRATEKASAALASGNSTETKRLQGIANTASSAVGSATQVNKPLNDLPGTTPTGSSSSTGKYYNPYGEGDSRRLAFEQGQIGSPNRTLEDAVEFYRQQDAQTPPLPAAPTAITAPTSPGMVSALNADQQKNLDQWYKQRDTSMTAVTDLQNKAANAPDESMRQLYLQQASSAQKLVDQYNTSIQNYQKMKMQEEETAVKQMEKGSTVQEGDITSADIEAAKAQEQDDLMKADALKNASLFSEVEARQSLTQLADETYSRQQEVYNAAQELYQRTLNQRNASLAATADVQRRDAEIEYQSSKFELEQQRRRSEKAYNDQLTEQKLNNMSRQLQKESMVAALGGFGSLWANKEIENTILENERIMNDIVFEKDDADRETSFRITQLNDAYQQDLYRIEVNKENAIQENYTEYLGYVQDLTEKRSLSATERQEAITTATNEYKRNVSQINQQSFELKYSISQAAREYADGLKEQIRAQVKEKKAEAKENLQTAVELLTSSPESLLSTDVKKLAELEAAAGMPVGMTARAVSAIKEELKKANVSIEQFSDGEDVVYVSVDRSDPANPVIKEVGRLDGLGSLSSTLALKEREAQLEGGVMGPGTSQVAQFSSVFMGSPLNADGVDFAGQKGSPITSSTSGTVVFAGNAGGWGNQVRIEDDAGNIHQFSHLDSIAVKQGQRVTMGVYLGGMGNTGNVLKSDGTKPTPEELAQGRGTHLDYTVYKPDGSKYTVEEAARFAGYAPAETEASSIAAGIMEGVSNLTLKDIPQKIRADVDAELSRLKAPILERFNERIAQGLPPDAEDVQALMRASAGGKPPSEAEKTKLGKISIVVDQVGQLNNVLNSGSKTITDQSGNKIDISPITGFIKSINPWSNEGQIAKAITQSTIANLARGVFGEVGVLTDHDIALYTQTLPNLSQPEDIRKSITALTLRTLRNTLESTLMDVAATGGDVSGYVARYKQLDNRIKSIEDELAAKISGTSSVEQEDLDFYNSL